MSDITLLGFDPAGIGKEREKMKTLKGMSGEELLDAILHTAAGDLSIEQWRRIKLRLADRRAEMLRRLALAERAEAAEALAARETKRAEDAADEIYRTAEILRTMNEETVLARYPGGGRYKTLGNIRAMARDKKAAEGERDTARRERDTLNSDYGLKSLKLANVEMKLATVEASLETARTALIKLKSYNEDIASGKINYRPEDHIQVASTAIATLALGAAEKLPER